MRLYRELVKQTPIGLMILQGDPTEDVRKFRIISLNPAVVAASGMRNTALEDLMGKTIGEVFPAVCDTELAPSFLGVVRSQRPRHLGGRHYGDSPTPDW